MLISLNQTIRFGFEGIKKLYVIYPSEKQQIKFIYTQRF